MAQQTYRDTSGTECVLVEHLRKVRLPDGSEQTQVVGTIGMPIEHMTQDVDREGKPIDKTLYGKPIQRVE
jgi:hypothetical protein